VDEIQTGFWRTGPVFASVAAGVRPDFITMAKGIAGGFPFGAVAVDEKIASAIEPGDHGGTYCGNPLGCAVAAATIGHLLASGIEQSVQENGAYLLKQLRQLQVNHSNSIKEVRGMGLLAAVEFADSSVAEELHDAALREGLILNIKHGQIIRIFPPLIISRKEIDEGVGIMGSVLDAMGY
ncbi:MAG: aminotransferase class III-fold pyridoxal phosphate-dependent enzyme, partial [Chitinispirillaceae bacterium]|nr:aminotransferase class III-fold pyridoxal phosphate-dependent enzyme [Chitinispirillaceae bacterium]